ncbi:MAG: YvcK family protein [Vallitaleaceae bacterium]|nr:YvcK family protein [Vallitaleaceae bacterium]
MPRTRRVVCVGGGTGMSTMLRGLKEYTDEITAIVTVADNGGSSGVLRKEMNMLPPGDIRNCLLALAETEPIMQEVFQYRFQEGSLQGQNMGNLFLAALTDIYGSFERAVEKANEVLAVKGQVLPVTTENVQLKATYEDGTTITGEHEIVYMNKVLRKKIQKVELLPESPKAYTRAIEALKKADIIVLGPGSLYTSLLPNLLVDGISEAIRESLATVVYVGNIMTQPGETDNYTLAMHLESIERCLGKGVIEYIIANRTILDKSVEEHYFEDGAIVVRNDLEDQRYYSNVIETDFAILSPNHRYIRHDTKKLAQIIMDLKGGD